jgi:hypothetical protein
MSENNQKNEYEEISIIEIINILLKGKVIIIIMLCIGLFLGLGYSLYKSAKTMPVSTSTIELVSSINEKINEEKCKLVFNDSDVEENAREIMGLKEDENLGFISFASNKNSLFSISIEHDDFDLANEVNYALIESYQQALAADYKFRYDQAEAAVLASIESLEGVLGDMDEVSKVTVISEVVTIVSENTDMVFVNVVEAPRVSVQGGTSTPKNIAISAILGLFLGFILVFMREWWNNNKEQLKGK